VGRSYIRAEEASDSAQPMAHFANTLASTGVLALVLRALWLLPDWVGKWLDLWTRLRPRDS
jgi:hypothetical protein